MKAHAVQYTIRGIPQEVDRVLRERAKKQHISINQLIVDELTQAMIGGQQRADFSDLVGQWRPDEGFDRTVEAQRKVNVDDWR